MERVVVGMSGGVDSSYAAYHLKKQGYEVIGVMLKLWASPGSEIENRCCSPDDMLIARRTASMLDIPFYTLDVSEQFKSLVVDEFTKGYLNGSTPNPCLACNVGVRWRFLLQQADHYNAAFIATGHYARIERFPNGEVALYKGVDTRKDQSYVLSALKKDQLRRTLLPLGNFTKDEIREKSNDIGLLSAKKPDSQDLCFLGNQDYRTFIRSEGKGGGESGEILDLQGKILGFHEGLENYTIGQSSKLRIAISVKMYVIKKDINKNQLIIGPMENRFSDNANARIINILNDSWLSAGREVEAKFRYNGKTNHVIIDHLTDDEIHVKIPGGAMDVTPGQGLVFYDNDVCLGCGIIV
jgi:tRNA-specific 2-thiouridylase